MSGDKKITYLKSLLEDMKTETNELITHHTNELHQISTVVAGISQAGASINHNHFFEVAEIINSRISFMRKLNIQRLRDTVDHKEDGRSLDLPQYVRLYKDKIPDTSNQQSYEDKSEQMSGETLTDNLLDSTSIRISDSTSLNNFAVETKSISSITQNTQIYNIETNKISNSSSDSITQQHTKEDDSNSLLTNSNEADITQINIPLLTNIDQISEQKLDNIVNKPQPNVEIIENATILNSSASINIADKQCFQNSLKESISENRVVLKKIGVNGDVAKSGDNINSKKNEISSPKLKISSELSGQFLRVVSPDEFYIFFGNPEDNNKFTTLMNEMQVAAQSSGKFLYKEQARKGLCSNFCMVHDDSLNFWYRAKVINWMMDHDSNILEIYYCDLGSVTFTDLQNIRYLPSRFAEFHAIASKCHLYNIKNIGNQWTDEILNYFQNFFECSCIVMENTGESHGVILYIKNINVNEEIINRGWAEQCNSGSKSNKNGQKANEVSKEFTKPLSAEEISALDNIKMDKEELCSTSNACVAVMGYAPKDESQICKFYNVKTGACFKRTGCTKKHEVINPDGWTNDRTTIHNCFLPASIAPAIGTNVYIKVTHISYPTKFHGIYEGDRGCKLSGTSKFNNMTDFADYMNSPDVVASYKKLKLEPALGELVIAPYSLDKCYYRAQVTSVPYKEYVTVTFIDYGNLSRVALKDLYQFSAEFSDFPVQAVTCTIANIVILHQKTLDPVQFREEVVSGLETLMLHRIVKCKVLDIHGDETDLHVIAELDNVDLAEHLEEVGYAKRISISESKDIEITRYLPA